MEFFRVYGSFTLSERYDFFFPAGIISTDTYTICTAVRISASTDSTCWAYTGIPKKVFPFF